MGETHFSGPVIVGENTASASTGIVGSFTQNSTYSHAAIGVARSVELTFASTTVDVMPGDLLSIGLRVDTADLSSAVNLASFRLSTVNASRLTVVLSNVQSTATSTGSGTLALSWIDLT